MAVLYTQRYTFQSGSWYFTVSVDSTGAIYVTEIQTPVGNYTFDSNAPIPESVVDDMKTAIDLVKSGNICCSGSTGTTGTTGFYVL